MARGVRSTGNSGTALVAGCVIVALVMFVMPARFQERFAASIRGTVMSPFILVESRASNARSAINSRADVLTVKGRLAVDAMNVRAVEDENTTLRRLLGLAARLQEGFVVAELLPKRGVDDDYVLTLSVGRNAGVEPFAPIVTADGLVGMVERVDDNTSFAITWAHPDFAVSAMSDDERGYGIVQPHLGSGVERLLLELRGVPFRDKLDSGTLIVSSGLGTTYPRGIPVGTIMGEIATPEKWARTYLLLPSVLPASLGPVLILRPERVAQGVNQIWTNVSSADSAARAIAAAGDSIARRAALDELAARRAALDSMTADSVARSPLPGNVPAVRPPTSRLDSLRADSIRRARMDSLRPRLPTVPPPGTTAGPPPGGPQ